MRRCPMRAAPPGRWTWPGAWRQRARARRSGGDRRRDLAGLRQRILRLPVCRPRAGAPAAMHQHRRARRLCRAAARHAGGGRRRADRGAGGPGGDAGRGRGRHRRVPRRHGRRDCQLAGGRRPGRAVRPRRALLHPVFVRQHELPARRARHAARDRRQRACHRRPRPGPAARRSLHFLAAALPRHGPGRLLPDAGDGADHRRLPPEHRVRAPAAAVAQAPVRPRRDDLVRPDLRVRAVHTPVPRAAGCRRASICRAGGSPASAAR